jgi:hypothetical protein
MVLSKLKYPSLRSRPAQGKSLAHGGKVAGRAEGFRRVGFLPRSSGKVSDASDFSPEAPGRFPTRRISSAKFREGFRHVGFLAGSLREGFRRVGFLPRSSGKVSDAKITLPELRGRFRRVGTVTDYLFHVTKYIERWFNVVKLYEINNTKFIDKFFKENK